MKHEVTSSELIDLGLSMVDLTSTQVTENCQRLADVTGLSFNVVAGIYSTTGTIMARFDVAIPNFTEAFALLLRSSLHLFAGYAATLYQNGEVVTSMDGPAWAVQEHVENKQMDLVSKKMSRLPEDGRWLTTAEVEEYRNR